MMNEVAIYTLDNYVMGHVYLHYLPKLNVGTELHRGCGQLMWLAELLAGGRLDYVPGVVDLSRVDWSEPRHYFLTTPHHAYLVKWEPLPFLPPEPEPRLGGAEEILHVAVQRIGYVHDTDLSCDAKLVYVRACQFVWTDKGWKQMSERHNLHPDTIALMLAEVTSAGSRVFLTGDI